ncbi:MAG: NADP-specific glutamate dehydrogenase [Planctomycetes bacterium]|nr:NADP-specific glutamate dehydrogenase [Planctomycetota bacterium]
MSKAVQQEIEHFMEGVVNRNPDEPEFQQAVHEVVESVMPFLLENKKYKEARVLERMTEPDRVIIFAVPWEDDSGEFRINRAYRVQFNSAIGPYKGGLRFHPSVTLSVLKFLGFEQTFKNSLTGLPMGGGKGGSNFNPKGRSDREVMRFCQSLMTELSRHIGEDTDVPAGDIGVGTREISYLFGQYKRMSNRFTGILTGKGLSFGGSAVRKEATGYGAVYFADDVMQHHGDGLSGKVAVVSGSGNVALYCIEKLVQLGAKVVSASDSGGTVYDPQGIDPDKLAWLKDLKENRRGRVAEYAEKFGCEFRADATPWDIECDLAFPCATQNELDATAAQHLAKNGAKLVVEGANMPTTAEAMTVLREAGVLVAPAKAANAGGVAVSGLEQSQNALRISWPREEVDERLKKIMKEIHRRCVEHGSTNGKVDYVHGANVAGFVKVADAMLSYGIV